MLSDHEFRLEVAEATRRRLGVRRQLRRRAAHRLGAGHRRGVARPAEGGRDGPGHRAVVRPGRHPPRAVERQPRAASGPGSTPTTRSAGRGRSSTASGVEYPQRFARAENAHLRVHHFHPAPGPALHPPVVSRFRRTARRSRHGDLRSPCSAASTSAATARCRMPDLVEVFVAAGGERRRAPTSRAATSCSATRRGRQTTLRADLEARLAERLRLRRAGRAADHGRAGDGGRAQPVSRAASRTKVHVAFLVEPPHADAVDAIDRGGVRARGVHRRRPGGLPRPARRHGPLEARPGPGPIAAAQPGHDPQLAHGREPCWRWSRA